MVINRDGTRAIINPTFSRWFRIWVLLLEQAIVLAKLASATGETVDRLCSVAQRDLVGGVLSVGGARHELPVELNATLVDVRAETSARPLQNGSRQQLPLFPCALLGEAASWACVDDSTAREALMCSKYLGPRALTMQLIILLFSLAKPTVASYLSMAISANSRYPSTYSSDWSSVVLLWRKTWNSEVCCLSRRRSSRPR